VTLGRATGAPFREQPRLGAFSEPDCVDAHF